MLNQLFRWVYSVFNLLGGFVLPLTISGVRYQVSFLSIAVAGIAVAICINMFWKGGKA